jgi:hypothetical protein
MDNSENTEEQSNMDNHEKLTRRRLILILFDLFVLNATFSNISAISWGPF